MAGERTEQASPRRRQKARAEGDRPRSRDLAAACATLGGTLALGTLASGWLDGWRSACERLLRLAGSPAWRSEDGVAAMLELRAISVETMLPLCGVLLACAAGALAAGVVQGGGWSVHPQGLLPKWSRIDPLSNIKNLFSLRAGARLGKTLLPVGALIVFAWGKLARQAEIPVFGQGRMPRAMKDAYDLLADAAWILFLWSAVDFAIEYRSWSQRLRMSKQELRDEYKETEGNPQIRGRIRNIQRQMRSRMIRADVAKASVVITNPTHYAVALTFDFSTMEAPRVLVKGRDLVAEQIKTEARWAGVPIAENPPLARSLYRTVEAGQAIPFELYAAVAGILAYLYRQQVEERIRRQAAASPPAGASGAAARAPAPGGGQTPAQSSQPSPPEPGQGPGQEQGRGQRPEQEPDQAPSRTSSPTSGQTGSGAPTAPGNEEKP
jgi:flagellar biosynthetic protein FlhB